MIEELNNNGLPENYEELKKAANRSADWKPV